MNALVNILANEFEDKEYADAYLEENSNLRIAAQVRALRIQRGWSQEELANRARMQQTRISKIEMADFDSLTLKTLRRLASAFDVHLSVQFGSAYEAVFDFLALSGESLRCDDRPASIRKMREHSATIVSTGFSSSQTGSLIKTLNTNTNIGRIKTPA